MMIGTAARLQNETPEKVEGTSFSVHFTTAYMIWDGAGVNMGRRVGKRACVALGQIVKPT